MITKKERMNILTNSYAKHVNEINFDPNCIFDKLSEIQFEDCSIQYVPDGMGYISITLFYAGFMRVVAIINLDNIDNSMYSIYYKKGMQGFSSSLDGLVKMSIIKEC